MEKGSSRMNSWHLFTSEEMIEGYDRRNARKRKYPAKNRAGVEANPHGSTPKSITQPVSDHPTSDAPVSDRLALSNITNICGSSNIGRRQNKKKHSTLVQGIEPTSTPLCMTESMRMKRCSEASESERVPLSNISNVGCPSQSTHANASTVGQCSIKTKLPKNVGNISRKLFEDDFNVGGKDNENIPDNSVDEETMYGEEAFFSDSSGGISSRGDCGHSDAELEVDDYIGTGDNTIHNVHTTTRGRKHVPEQYATLGCPSAQCSHCGARMWKEERVNKNVVKGSPIFSMCCQKGLIKLPKVLPTPNYLAQLYQSEEKGPAFRRMIRLYNSMFAFTSTGGNIDHSINCGRAPYIYRLNGQNHHVFGSLIPNDEETPKFCQLYVYDTANEVANRMRWINVNDQQTVDAEVVQGLITMLDGTNELVKRFRTARDRFESKDYVDLDIKLEVCRAESGRENNVGPSDEVAGILVGDTDETCGDRDIIVHEKQEGLQRVSYVHPKVMALQYPILFPNGEDGFHAKIPFQSNMSSGKSRKFISLKDYYSYHFQIRENEGMTPRLGGRLFQQYMVDAYSSIEQTRLWWFRTHQTILRNELYTHICDSVRKGDCDSSNVGKGVILPAGFVGSRRYMQQNFQDALAVCRVVGHPDIFLTMTCNPLWDEIKKMMEFVPGCLAANCPDIISRVFRLKLDQLLTDVKKKNYFGRCVGVMYVVEFQKRGLPHVHMLIWLDSASKKFLKNNVDKFVSAEIPDEDIDPVGYAAVKEFMIHGPCGLQNLKSPCMKKCKCIRHFPKKYCAQTTFDDSGFPSYRRRKNGITVHVRKADLDNQWVVPYNRDLLVKYQCHMNVEICCHARSLKYLFKYCLKGADRATVRINGRRTRRGVAGDDDTVDEINAFFDGRYVCGAEAAWRIFGFPIHHRSLSVERLPFHLPGARNCTFSATEPLGKVLRREKEKLSKLEAFFQLNATDSEARKYTYDEIPKHYVWNDADTKWTQRKRGYQIGRLSYAHHSSGEVWFLRLLLTKVRGCTSFRSLRTVNGVEFKTFRDACKEYGLLDDDKEWHEVLQQCALGGLPPQIRQLFVHIIVNCKVSDVLTLWCSHWRHMVDDIMLKKRQGASNNDGAVNDKQLQFYALAEIDNLLRSIGKSLKNFSQLPQPPSSYLNHGSNNLVIEETSYNIVEMENENKKLVENFNEEQLQVYKSVNDSVERNEGGLFFVYGSGGCGKTYLWRALITRLRSRGDVVLPVASSGIAATLLPGGRTAHSRFKIPIALDDFSVCSIPHESDIAELIKQTKLIIWDEAPMQHRYAFECLDRSLKDIMKSVNPGRGHQPFGGITILLGGDFRQILPVIPQGQRGEIVSSCITRSPLWRGCKIFLLTQNMRIHKGQSNEDKVELKKFAQWVLSVGDGTVMPPDIESGNHVENDIKIPAPFCDLDEENSVENMVRSTYPDFTRRGRDSKYLSERAILTPTNHTVGHLNSLIVEKLPGESVSYFSVDTAEEFGGTDADLHSAFPVEYLNSINIPGMPLHELKLKVGVVVMLMRNLNQTLGLCNGTRMIITKCLKFCVECEVICGSFIGTRHFIPRMELCPSDTRLPFKLVRKQMPLQICYAMTINKSQGQSLETVGLYLPKSVFSHGQFYVAVSRVTSAKGLKIFIDDESGMPSNVTQNVVFKEVFYGLPRANVE